MKNGLSNNKINAILQDKTGFIWFGTEDGLNRFDGYNFKVYRNDPTDSNSISHNNIWAIFADENDNIWIGTKSGVLNLYDRRYDSFRHWTIKSKFVKENSITAIYKDRNNSLWIGTYQSGLLNLIPKPVNQKVGIIILKIGTAFLIISSLQLLKMQQGIYGSALTMV